MEFWGEVVKFMQEGGSWMYVIAAVACITLAIAIERTIMLYFRYSINAQAFMAQITKLVMANNIDRAIKLCNAAQNAVLPRVIKAGLTKANKGELEVAQAIEEATLDIIPRITKRTDNLVATAQIATYLGLLGTIMGMIQAFAVVASAPPDKKAVMLASAISVAMNTTAFGLLVAIPANFVYMLLMNLTKQMIGEIDQYSVRIQNLLGARARGTTAA